MERLGLGFKVDTEVDTRGLSKGERMFWHSRGQTRVSAVAVEVINELFNNENRRHSERSIIFTTS
ncbi:hypothetical protein J1N35_007627 [Gossypium stocksii]|uniref:Uncharacterized protein n=1 Tax=Gossypium stocksii TaxID=47602 RepID=A0A9D3W6F6_9ROSI|nr:hypothetical protein J1N35_007627 [Gossypium stocksii]